MPQFPHHSKLCHCCQSIVHLSPGIMAKKSTRDGDLTLTEKLIHGDFPTGVGFFSAGGKKKCIYTHTYTPLAHCAPRSQGYLCLPQAEFSPELSRFTAAWPFCPQELFALEVNLHFPIYMLKSECTGKQTPDQTKWCPTPLQTTNSQARLPLQLHNRSWETWPCTFLPVGTLNAIAYCHLNTKRGILWPQVTQMSMWEQNRASQIHPAFLSFSPKEQFDR